MELRLWDWMVKPTHQEEWIEGKGLLSWLSFFSVALGAGMYFMAVVIDSRYLMLAGWLVTLVIGGGTKFLDLGKPTRAWRMLIDYDAPGNIFNMIGYAITHPAGIVKMWSKSGWKHSWISRGMYFIGLYAIIGIVQIALVLTDVLGSTGGALGIIMAIVSLLVIVYAGLLIGRVKAIPLWGSALMPVYFLVSAITSATAVALIAKAVNTGIDEGDAILTWYQPLAIVFAGVVVIYMWNAWITEGSARYAVVKMLKDAKLSRIFYVGVVICGMILPIVASIVTISGTISSGLLIAGAVGVIIGDLSMRFLLMRCGYYTTLLPETPY